MKTIAPTSFSQADAAISALQPQRWAALNEVDRIRYLHQSINGILQVADQWSIAACEAKGIDPTSSLAGEEWLAGVVTTLLNVRCLIKTLSGSRAIPALRQRGDQIVAQVLPDDRINQVLWFGFKGEIWLQPNKPATRGMIRPAKVALVLGAGNIAATAPMDVLYKLFVENQVVLLKMNPVNQYLGAFFERAFESLIRDGFLSIVYGDAELGGYLCQHPGIDTVHMTGSHHTHNAIVWGTSTEQPHKNLVLKKPITSELGCVTPVIIVPGDWSKSDLAFQARNLASMVAHNASFNCASAKVVLTAKNWAQRSTFLDHLRRALAAIPPRRAYYPGAQQRYQAFLDRYPNAEVFGHRTDEIIPWTLITDVKADSSESALSTEAFCGVLAEVSLDATTATEFLQQSTQFVNRSVWGNLSCVMLIDPKTQRQHRSEFEAAIADLRYGAIGVNVWSGVIYGLPDLTWGAFPENSIEDIRSGLGVVHNAYGFDYPQKSVLYAPFRIRPTPVWFANHRNLLKLAQRLAQLQAVPTWSNAVKSIFEALKG